MSRDTYTFLTYCNLYVGHPRRRPLRRLRRRSALRVRRGRLRLRVLRPPVGRVCLDTGDLWRQVLRVGHEGLRHRQGPRGGREVSGFLSRLDDTK